ncbi:hypothetical protein [Flavobacterium sp.]|uniref:hypothetical protein n=1 Tax=Flavobacterium sp. TaxID=239 RepID=UPI00260E5183|nr:hypothetical protein [Flavobacterium sp.]
MKEFIIENWDKIVSGILSIYATILSTYTFIKQKDKLKVEFSLGYMHVKQKNYMYRLASINIINLSQNPLKIKGAKFHDIKGKIVDISGVPEEITKNVLRSEMDFENKVFVDVNQEMSKFDKKTQINPYDDRYLYYDYISLKKYMDDNKVIYFTVTHNNGKKKIKITNKKIFDM